LAEKEMEFKIEAENLVLTASSETSNTFQDSCDNKIGGMVHEIKKRKEDPS